MMLAGESLNIALKEWASVCRALETGRQMILFRKGGIHESAGEFELDHKQFLLFPTYLHQKLEIIKRADRAGAEEQNREPARLQISAAAKVTDIRPMASRGQLDALDSEHIWLPGLLDTRWNYRPENPLYLLLLRVYRLSAPATIANALEYAGCKSWVPLSEAISTAGRVAAMSDDEYARRRAAIFANCGLS